jgi:hypothetical protein
MAKMFSTHPPMGDRIARLEKFADEWGQHGYHGDTTGRYR